VRTGCSCTAGCHWCQPNTYIAGDVIIVSIDPGATNATTIAIGRRIAGIAGIIVVDATEPVRRRHEPDFPKLRLEMRAIRVERQTEQRASYADAPAPRAPKPRAVVVAGIALRRLSQPHGGLARARI
jgi:hypothetical protein